MQVINKLDQFALYSDLVALNIMEVRMKIGISRIKKGRLYTLRYNLLVDITEYINNRTSYYLIW